MYPKSPDCSVEVVEETMMLFSWAKTDELFMKIAKRRLRTALSRSFFIVLQH
jgi:hypothetical protein